MTTLAHIGNEYLQTWVQELGMDKKFEIKVRNPMTFPSCFAVYSEGTELMQFNIFKKWYGIREKAKKEEKIQKQNQEEKDRLNSIIEEEKNKINDYKTLLAKPWKRIKYPGDILILLFKRKEIKKEVNKQIERMEKVIKETEEKIIGLDESIPVLIEKNRLFQENVEILTPFFTEFGYTLETNTYNLY